MGVRTEISEEPPEKGRRGWRMRGDLGPHLPPFLRIFAASLPPALHRLIAPAVECLGSVCSLGLNVHPSPRVQSCQS